MALFPRFIRLTLLLLVGVQVGPAAAQSAPFLLFGNQPPHGLWRLELIDTGDPIAQGTRGSEASICMDPSLNPAGHAPRAGGVTCTQKSVQNTPSLAQFESSCSDGRVTRVTMTREADKIFSFTASESGGTVPPTTIKGRYHYEGPCGGDAKPGSVQVDKNSDTCRQMRAQVGSTTLESACGEMPAGAYRDACIKQMEPLFKVLKSCE